MEYTWQIYTKNIQIYGRDEDNDSKQNFARNFPFWINLVVANRSLFHDTPGKTDGGNVSRSGLDSSPEGEPIFVSISQPCWGSLANEILCKTPNWLHIYHFYLYRTGDEYNRLVNFALIFYRWNIFRPQSNLPPEAPP